MSASLDLNPGAAAPAQLAARLPRLSGNEARALDLVARHGAALDIVLGQGGPRPGAWQVSLTPGVADGLLAGDAFGAEIEWAGARLHLTLPRAAPAAWLAERHPELAPAPLPDALAALALEGLLAEIQESVAGLSPAGPARVTAAEAELPALPHLWTLSARANGSGATVYARLAADGLGLLLLAGLLAQGAIARNGLALEALPVLLRADIGATRLPASALATLQPRDVLLLDHYYVSEQGELWLSAGQGQGLRVRADASTYIVTQGWTSLMTEPQADAAPQAEAQAPAAPLALADIPVNLTFDLGERRITLAQLQTLQVGATFDLQRPLADGPVMIRANGALVGTGNLVQIDDRIGVVLATLGPGAA
ncbi:type III secretion system cytoplasmic ring protein SctQ [Bordetella genomosp. 1]|uniref:type III secretion system cytoplasmic ring protein SctQ n=1 Tax=Bordetella genomosp. 1 TaxID=1395607 RepID=UPI0020CE8B35|nr:type III secretion system cytoplasmic ring protein SctQ [Bordetella genomosp. 1]